jgi:hypothetical protein
LRVEGKRSKPSFKPKTGQVIVVVCQTLLILQSP